MCEFVALGYKIREQKVFEKRKVKGVEKIPILKTEKLRNEKGLEEFEAYVLKRIAVWSPQRCKFVIKLLQAKHFYEFHSF